MDLNVRKARIEMIRVTFGLRACWDMPKNPPPPPQPRSAAVDCQTSPAQRPSRRVHASCLPPFLGSMPTAGHPCRAADRPRHGAQHS